MKTLTGIANLERQHYQASRKLKRQQANQGRLEVALAGIRQPFLKKISRLQEEMLKATTELGRRLEESAGRIRQTEEQEAKLLRNLRITKARSAVPTDEEFKHLAGLASYFIRGFDEGNETYFLGNPFRTQNVPGFVIKAMGDSRKKVYFVWKADGELVGVMEVEPSRYPGDNTTAEWIVYGKRMAPDYINAPLEKFLAAIQKGK